MPRPEKEPEPETGAGRFGREERFPRPRQGDFVHAVTLVDDLDAHAGTLVDAHRDALIGIDASNAFRSSAMSAWRRGSTGTSRG